MAQTGTANALRHDNPQPKEALRRGRMDTEVDLSGSKGHFPAGWLQAKAVSIRAEKQTSAPFAEHMASRGKGVPLPRDRMAGATTRGMGY